jgi:hypothetical protein
VVGSSLYFALGRWRARRCRRRFLLGGLEGRWLAACLSVRGRGDEVHFYIIRLGHLHVQSPSRIVAFLSGVEEALAWLSGSSPANIMPSPSPMSRCLRLVSSPFHVSEGTTLIKYISSKLFVQWRYAPPC